MAKELPYFKFEPAEYLTKDISFCSFEAQGFFISLCSYYWQRNCKMTKKQAIKRLKNEAILDELISEGIVDLNGENLTIKFLDNQVKEIENTSKQNSKNAKKGWEKRRKQKDLSDRNATASKPQSEKQKTAKPNQSHEIREEEIRRDKKRVDEDVYYATDVLKKFYLQDYRLCNAVIENQKLKSQHHLSELLTDFNQHLTQIGQHSKSLKDYSSHFIHWMRKKKTIQSTQTSSNDVDNFYKNIPTG